MQTATSESNTNADKPSHFTDFEWRLAKNTWRFFFFNKAANEELQPFLKIPSQTTPTSWLRHARVSLCLTTEAIANQLKITRAAYTGLEKRELDGSLTIEKLREAAEAMDCELIYALRPKGQQDFADVLWQKLATPALTILSKRNVAPQMKGQALAAIAQNLFSSSKFRKSQGWSERLQTSQDPQSD